MITDQVVLRWCSGIFKLKNCKILLYGDLYSAYRCADLTRLRLLHFKLSGKKNRVAQLEIIFICPFTVVCINNWFFIWVFVSNKTFIFLFTSPVFISWEKKALTKIFFFKWVFPASHLAFITFSCHSCVGKWCRIKLWNFALYIFPSVCGSCLRRAILVLKNIFEI